jgi:hypothetical protein
MEYDVTLFTPVLLMSRVVLMNWKGGVEKETILDLLATLVYCANRIQIDDSDGSGGDGDGGAPAAVFGACVRACVRACRCVYVCVCARPCVNEWVLLSLVCGWIPLHKCERCCGAFIS